MACKGVQLDWEIVSCPICLDVLTEPVTVPCGHNYCKDCINAYWDTERDEQAYGCPQCRRAFTPRPDLLKNTTLAAVVEELKKAGQQAAPAERRRAGSGDVACDVCMTLQAVKSCLVCLVSFCEKHLQPHRQMAPLMEHKLVAPCHNLQENACLRHGEVKTVFCRTDQLCICPRCCAESHKGHDTVSAAAERRDRQRKLAVRQLEIQFRIRDRKEDATVLQQRAEAIDRSAHKAVKDGHQILTQVIHFLENQRCEVEKQVRSRQEAEASWVREAEQELDREVTELRSREDELRRILDTEDDNQFLQRSASLSPLRPARSPPRFSEGSQSYFEDMIAALSQSTSTLQKAFSKKIERISQKRSETDSLAPQSEPLSRADFLKYSCKVTLDADTAHTQLHLSAGNTTATVTSQSINYPSHPGRFTQCCQVLAKASMTGRCYWEVKWEGPAVYIAVAHADVKRDGGWTQSGFGSTKNSWALYCDNATYIFCHNRRTTPVPGPLSSTLGVYLDHSAGVLSFCSITNKTTTVLFKIHTRFTQPLYAGFGFHTYPGNKVEIVKL